MTTTRRTRRTVRTASDKVICYERVSTQEQADSALGLEAQHAALLRECEARGWREVEWITDAGYSAKNLGRPGMQRALAMLASGEAGTLAAAKLDRISRSVVDASSLMTLAQEQGFALVLLDVGVDTTTAAGRMVANVMASVAEWERDTIRERTRSALAAKRAQGVRLGRPVELSADLRRRIVTLRNEKRTYAAIATILNEEQVPTARGRARWYPMTVHQIVNAA